MKFIKNIYKRALNNRGDTIVEVLIAIGIAAFAIGISYATAQRSLDKSITAREHNQALNLIENQLADLKIRFQNSTPSTPFDIAIASKNHFCLDDNASGPNIAATWDPYLNDSSVSQSSPLTSSSTPDRAHPYYYNSSASPPAGCENQRPGDGADYFIDITTKQGSSSGANDTLYQITVRWSPVGGGQTSQASLNYKLNGSTSATLGIAGFNPPPPPPPATCTGIGTPWTISENDGNSVPVRLRLANQLGSLAFYGNWSPPWPVDSNCKYKILISENVNRSSAAPPNQQMFVELCADITATTCSLTGNSASYLYRSPNLNPDITLSTRYPTSTDVFALSSTPKYVVFKHCALWPTSYQTCRTAANPIDEYDVTFTPEQGP